MEFTGKITLNECYELDTDYQVQFLGNEVFPKPRYIKINLSERTINQVHYDDVYVIEPGHYYYITFNEKIVSDTFYTLIPLSENGIIFNVASNEDRMYLFNGSKNIVYLQKNMTIGMCGYHG